MPKTRVLVVEDAEPRMAALIKQTLERRSGIAVDIVGSGDAAVRSVHESLPNLIIWTWTCRC